jgi:hypothetical protein
MENMGNFPEISVGFEKIRFNFKLKIRILGKYSLTIMIMLSYNWGQ